MSPLFLLLSIVTTVFWIVALIDCLKNEPNQGNSKILWVIVILLGHFIGALIYWLVRRPQR